MLLVCFNFVSKDPCVHEDETLYCAHLLLYCSTSRTVCLSTCLSLAVCLPICLPDWLPICQSVRPPIRLLYRSVHPCHHLPCLPVCPSSRPPFCLSTSLPTYLSVYHHLPVYTCLSTRPSFYPSSFPFICLTSPSVCLVFLSIHPSVCLKNVSAYLSPCLSGYSSVNQSIYPSVCLSTGVCLHV